MEDFKAVRTMLAVRNYEDKPVPPALVRRIVEAAWLTGSSMNKQPWYSIVVEDRDVLQQLGEIASTGPYIAQAPLAIVVAIEPSRFSVSDSSRAMRPN
jgi:nitroreductase